MRRRKIRRSAFTKPQLTMPRRPMRFTVLQYVPSKHWSVARPQSGNIIRSCGCSDDPAAREKTGPPPAGHSCPSVRHPSRPMTRGCKGARAKRSSPAGNPYRCSGCLGRSRRARPHAETTGSRPRNRRAKHACRHLRLPRRHRLHSGLWAYPCNYRAKDPRTTPRHCRACREAQMCSAFFRQRGAFSRPNCRHTRRNRLALPYRLQNNMRLRFRPGRHIPIRLRSRGGKAGPICGRAI